MSYTGQNYWPLTAEAEAAIKALPPETLVLPTTFDGLIDHMVKRHHQFFMSSGVPATNPDEALEYQHELHDHLHKTQAELRHVHAEPTSSEEER